MSKDKTAGDVAFEAFSKLLTSYMKGGDETFTHEEMEIFVRGLNAGFGVFDD